MRQFKTALAADPACAMCAWGVAWQLGPNINMPERGDLKEARQYVVHAQRHADTTTPRERGLIDAMAAPHGVAERASVVASGPSEGDVCRGSKGGKPTADPLDIAYAEHLHALLLAAPDDADLLSLWSEAAMIVTKDDWWDEATGKPAPRIGEMVDRLEKLLARQPNHTVLGELERWAGGGEHLCGAALTLADLHAYPMLRYFSLAAEGDAALQRHPRLLAWMACRFAGDRFCRAERFAARMCCPTVPRTSTRRRFSSTWSPARTASSPRT